MTMALLKLLKDDPSLDNMKKWADEAHLIETLFEEHGAELLQVKTMACKIRDGINQIDSFVQQAAAAVCPSCEKVCCINRHGYYDCEDLIYIYALGLKLPAYKECVRDADPCQFLSMYGCTTQRSIRPFRCNWYFCNPLLEYMEKCPQRQYREFINRFHEIIDLRAEMIKEFLIKTGQAAEHNTGPAKHKDFTALNRAF
jgi:hypothetical protein